MKKYPHETIILYRVPEFHRDTITFYCVDKASNIKRSFSGSNAFDSIVGRVLNIMEKSPHQTYGIKVPSPKEAGLNKKQIGILEQIVELYNLGAKLEYARREIGEIKAKQMEEMLEKSYAAVTQRMKVGRNIS